MILATGVQLPGVLRQPLGNTNERSEQFFSKFIDTLLVDYEQRHPADHYSALRQWKQSHVRRTRLRSSERERERHAKALIFFACQGEGVDPSIGHRSSHDWIGNIGRSCSTETSGPSATIFPQCSLERCSFQPVRVDHRVRRRSTSDTRVSRQAYRRSLFPSRSIQLITTSSLSSAS